MRTLGIIAFTLVASIAGAQSQDTTLETIVKNKGVREMAIRYKFAQELVELNPPLEAMKRDGHPLMQQPVVAQVLNQLDPSYINQQAVDLMAASFTAQELVALKEFNQSELGQSINAKMPAFQKMLGGVVQDELEKKFNELRTSGQLQNPESLNAPGFGIPSRQRIQEAPVNGIRR